MSPSKSAGNEATAPGDRDAVWNRAIEVLSGAAGTFGLSYHHLGTGYRYSYHGDQRFYACSVIKVPVMCEVFRQIEAGLLDAARKIVVNRDDQVGGSGVIQVLTPGTELSIWDLMTLMIVVSDNTATNMLIDLIGLDAVSKFMEKLGLDNIRLFHKLMIVEYMRPAENFVSPDDVTELMARIARNEVVSARACEEMVRIMKKQQYNDHLTKYLPLDTEGGRFTGSMPPLEVAHKNGWITGTRLCTGIFYLPDQEYVLTVATTKVADDRAADEAIAQVGKMVYEWVREKA